MSTLIIPLDVTADFASPRLPSLACDEDRHAQGRCRVRPPPPKGSVQADALAQDPPSSVAIVARTTVDPGSLAKALETAVHALQPDLPVQRIRPMTTLMSGAVATRRLSTLILAVFGVVAILIAAVGLYGVVSHSVTERTREIGVRIALGAERRGILLLFIGQGLTIAVIGAAVGLAGALGLASWLRQLVFGVEPTDPATLATVGTILLAVAAIACYVPARRATRVDPLVALKAE
jgi:putative ABC transport system permease protein